jgi:hypothetical protein
MEETRKGTQTDMEESRNESRAVTDEPQKKSREDPPPPLVTTTVPKKRVSISERMKSGELAHEEEPSVIQARKGVKETLLGCACAKGERRCKKR